MMLVVLITLCLLCSYNMYVFFLFFSMHRKDDHRIAGYPDVYLPEGIDQRILQDKEARPDIELYR